MKYYNDEVKQQFLLEFDGNLNPVKKLFNKISKVEKEYEVDIYNASMDELTLMLAEISEISLASKQVLLSDLRRYIDWAIVNNKTTNPENLLNLIKLEEINTEKLYEVKFFKDYEDLINFSSIVFSDYKEERVDLSYLCILLLLYNKIELRDIFEIKKEDYDSNNSLIRIKDKECKLYPLTNKIIKAFDNCKILTTTTDSIRRLQENEYLIRTIGCRKSFDKFLSYVNYKFFFKIQLYKKYTNKIKKVSPKNVYKSGVFFEIYSKGIQDKNEIIDIIKQYYSYSSEALYGFIYQEYLQWYKYYYM